MRAGRRATPNTNCWSKKTKINGIKLKETIDQYGSLQEAINADKSEKEALVKEVAKRKEEKHNLILEKDELVAKIADFKKQFEADKKKVELAAANASVEELKSLKINTVYPGHGKPFRVER